MASVVLMSFSCVSIQAGVRLDAHVTERRSDFASAAVADGLAPEATFTNT